MSSVHSRRHSKRLSGRGFSKQPTRCLRRLSSAGFECVSPTAEPHAMQGFAAGETMWDLRSEKWVTNFAKINIPSSSQQFQVNTYGLSGPAV